MGPTGRPPHWVGRAAELAVLRQAVADLRDGQGRVVWVEGEPGIGKSTLVAVALADCDPGWNAGWGMADQLAGRLPLRVMLDCLQVRPGSPDPRRSRAAGTRRPGARKLERARDPCIGHRRPQSGARGLRYGGERIAALPQASSLARRTAPGRELGGRG